MRSLDCIRYALWSLLFCIGLVQLTSCGEDDGPQTNGNGQVLAYLYDVEEQDTTSTKAPKSTWSTGDAIGVYCVEPGKSLGQVNYASNCKYVYDGSKFKPATTDDNIWISRQGSFKFYAYYPYDASKTGANATALEFTLKTDQSVEANRVASDIIAGQSYTADNTTGEVNMIFYHMMSDVRFVWTRDDAENGEYVRALFAPKAIVNLDQLTSVPAPGQSVGTGIRMNVKTPFNAVAGSTEYQVYVPPTTITHNQDIFVPYDASNSKLSSVKANIGSAGSTKQLERGKTYDLAGTMYTVTADVRRNGDLVSDQCDDFDGCVVNTSGGGDAGNLKKFVGRYLTGRTCTVTAKIASGVVTGTQFIGWFEYDRTTGTWTKVPGASETYTFDVTKNRRLQARYENYVFGNWVMSWTHSGVTKDGSGNFTTTIANTGTASSGLTLVPKATRTVTLDGENVTDPAFTTREGSQIKLAVTSQNPTTDMWSVNPWTYADASKNLKVTPNIDFTDNGTSGTPKERNLVLSVTLLEGGTNYNATTKKYDDVTLSGNGGNMKVVQSKGTISYGSWNVETVASNNSNMNANGSTTATVNVYAYRSWSLSGQTVKVESTSAYTNITGAFTSTDSHWAIAAGSTGLTKTMTASGHEFTIRNGRSFTVTAGNNKTESSKSITGKFTSNSVSKNVTFSQSAGAKTNKTWDNWSITLTASPTTLTTNPSSGTVNTSVITTSASRKMHYRWNGVASDTGSEDQTGNPSIAITTGSTYATLSGSTSGSRVSVQKNYDASSIGTNVPDRSIVVTATLANTENGSASSTKTVTIMQKGGTVTETRDTPTGGSIMVNNTLGSAANSSSTYTVTNPTRKVHVMLNGTTELSTYDETGELTSVTSNNSAFTPTTSSVKASANLDNTTTDYGTWSAGSVTIANSGTNVANSGGSRSVTVTVPKRTNTLRYNTTERSATLTGKWSFKNTTTGATESNLVSKTCTVKQSGSTATISTSTDSYTITGSTVTGAATYDGGSNASGTITYASNKGSTTYDYSSWSTGSVTLENTTYVNSAGGSKKVTIVAPSRTKQQRYNTSERSSTLTVNWKFGSTTGSASATLKQSGCSDNIGSSTTETMTIKSVTSSNSAASYSGGTSTSGTVTWSDNRGTPVSKSDSWTTGSISLSNSSFGRTGGTATVTISNPTRNTWKQYDTSSRNSTIKATFGFTGESDKTAQTTSYQSGNTNKVSGSDNVETASCTVTMPSGSTFSSYANGTLTVNESTSTYTSYWIGSNSGSVTASDVPAGGGTVKYSVTNPNAGWETWYSATNNSGSLKATWSDASQVKSVSYTQKSNAVKNESGPSGSGTSSVTNSVKSWPSSTSNGSVGANPGTSRRSLGNLTVTFSYHGKTLDRSCTVYQTGSTVTYSDYRITVSPATMSFGANDAASAAKTYTVTYYRTKYVNGVKGSEEKTTGTVNSCTAPTGFSANTSKIWPTGASSGPSKSGTATVYATPNGGSKLSATISVSQSAQSWWVQQQ